MQIPFASSPRSSLGVEWELELVDVQTRELASGRAATDILNELALPFRGADGSGEHPKAKHELFESCVEVITGVCTTVDEALSDLQGTVDEVSRAAEKRGLALMSSGTHPFSNWATQQISPNPRYAKLVEDMQWMARRLLIFGVHVHVGVRSPDKVIPIVNALTAYIPHFLALSASSPYWKGADSGLASARSKVFEALPTAGLPHQLTGWEDFERFMETLISANTISTIREVWWDIRPHPQFGTVELRICDGLPTLMEIGWAAAMSQCLVEMFNGQLDKGYTLPAPREWTVRNNKWRAARHGLDAEIIVDESGRTVPVRDAIAELIDDLTPIADRLECTKELLKAKEILAVGPSYVRQRATAAEHGDDLRAVVDLLIEEMKSGAPIVRAGR